MILNNHLKMLMTIPEEWRIDAEEVNMEEIYSTEARVCRIHPRF